MTRTIPAFFLLALLVGGCPDAAPGPTPTPADEPTSTSAPWAALNEMDPRTPVPLQPMMAWHQKQNMQKHLVAIQGITEALSREDWDGVRLAAAEIESSPKMAMQCEHMGMGAEGFTELALEFHRRADAIALAADAKDSSAVLAATAHTLGACTTCHASYRQDVVDAADWSARTGSGHEPMDHGQL